MSKSQLVTLRRQRFITVVLFEITAKKVDDRSIYNRAAAINRLINRFDNIYYSCYLFSNFSLCYRKSEVFRLSSEMKQVH